MPTNAFFDVQSVKVQYNWVFFNFSIIFFETVAFADKYCIFSNLKSQSPNLIGSFCLMLKRNYTLKLYPIL